MEGGRWCVLPVDLILADVHPKPVGHPDHLPHGGAAEIVGVSAFLEGSEGNAKHGTGHIFSYIAHEFKPQPFDHIGIDLIIDPAAVEQLFDGQDFIRKMAGIVFFFSRSGSVLFPDRIRPFHPSC